MIAMFTRCSRTVVTAGAGAACTTVVERDRFPTGLRGMTGVTGRARGHMIGMFARGGGPIVAACASPVHTTVIEGDRLPVRL